MAADTLARLQVHLEAESSKLRAELEKTNKRLDKFGRRTQRTVDSVGAQFKRLERLVIGSAIAVGIQRAVSGVLETADKFDELSIRLGASTEALSQYKYVAEQTGVTFQTLNMGWQRMTRRVAEAAQGTGEAKAALKELGVDAAKLNQLKPERQFEILADALMNVGTESDRVRLAMKLFDSEGVALLQTMQGGSGAMQALRQEADRLGITMSKEMTQKASDARDAFGRVQAAINGVANEIVINLAPQMEETANFMTEALPVAAGWAIGALNSVASQTKTTAEWFAAWRSGQIDFWEWFAADNDDAKARLQELKQQFGMFANQVDESDRKVKQFSVSLGDVLLPAGGASPEDEKAVEARKTSIQSLIDKLKDESATFGMTAAEITQYQLAKLGADKVTKDLAASLSDEVEAAQAIQEIEEDNARIFKDSEEAVKRHAQELQSYADSLTRTHNPAQQTADDLAMIEEAFDKALISEETYFRAIDEAFERMNKDAEEGADKAKSAAEELGLSFASAFEDAIVAGGSLSDVLRGLEQDILRIFVRKQITEPMADFFGGAFGGSNLFQSLFGFASGGSFTVGGSGGTDSQLVAFRASPNERVTVETPSQQMGGGNGVTINMTVNTPDANSFRQSGRQISQDIRQHMAMVY